MRPYSFDPIYVGNTSDPLDVDIGRSLVGATAMTFTMVRRATGEKKVDAAAAIQHPSSTNTIRRELAAADVNTAGEYHCTFRATLADGTQFVSPPIELEIRANP